MDCPFNAYQVSGMLLDDKVAYFENFLRSTGRKGVEDVINFLRKSDFYVAPASSKYHSNYRSGLLDHSLIVLCLMSDFCKVAIQQNPELAPKIEDSSIILTSLLHDICKTGLYTETIKYTKDSSTGNWISYVGYEINDGFPIGHGEKSVIMLQDIGLEMRIDEMLAIRFHMGYWGDPGGDTTYSQRAATDMTPLVTLLQSADFSASTIMEKTIKIK